MRSTKKAPEQPPNGARKVGRPRKEISAEQIEQLAAIQCTDEEIAAVLGISSDTLARRKSEPGIKEALDGGKAKGRASLRRMQWQAAKNGSVPMMIFLGKNLLGQRDKVEEASDDTLDKARQIRDAIKAMTDVETSQEAVN